MTVDFSISSHNVLQYAMDQCSESADCEYVCVGVGGEGGGVVR